MLNVVNLQIFYATEFHTAQGEGTFLDAHYTIEEMHQHPHPPQSLNIIPNYSSPYRRPHSNPNPSMTDKQYYSPLQRNTPLYHKNPNTSLYSRGSYDGNNLVKMKNADQVFLYQNPLHYGSSTEDLSPGQELMCDSGDFLCPTTPSRQLGSGSGESGYHGSSYYPGDANLSSSISSATSTPSRHGPASSSAAFPNRSGYHQVPRNISNSGEQANFHHSLENDVSPNHGTYGLPTQP